MITVISHFYNEEFLLPYWLKHHRDIFDHGIMINYGSTDRSVEIIEELVPGWTLVDSINDKFNAELVDEEVMMYERAIEGWKTALNTTEFFYPKDLEFTNITEPMLYRCDATFVVGKGDKSKPYKGKFLDEPLYGFNEFEKHGRVQGLVRARIVHNLEDGRYHSGRHDCDYGWGGRNEDLKLYYVADYPWSSEMLKRKMQTLGKLDKEHERLVDKDPNNKGHYRTKDEWQEYHDMLLAKSGPIHVD